LVTLVEDVAIISAVAGILLAFFTAMQLRHFEKHRNVDISMKLFEWAETDQLRKAFKYMDKKYQFTNYTEHKKLEETDFEPSEYPVEVMEFFEQVGFLITKKFVDLDVVADRLGHYIILNWQRLQPWIEGVRKETNDSSYGEHFEHLFNLTVNYQNKHKPKK
jgi:hypothetical protein